MTKIRAGIAGYGNLGKGAELAIQLQDDMELEAIFTRRDPETIVPSTPEVPVLPVDAAENYVDKIDVMLVCGSSRHDLPEQGPGYARMFHTVDSYDIHETIPAYFQSMDETGKDNNKTNIISVGWDPGLFSVNRVMAEAILPDGATYTFWGEGLSQGHSDAVRRVEGVNKGVQYTIPSETAIARVRNGEIPDLSKSERHRRECYIVPEDNADRERVKTDIKTMPHYFDDYDTEVYFITDEEFSRDHDKAPHGGFVIRSGMTGDHNRQMVEYRLSLGSNPEFTGSALVAYARAAYRMGSRGQYGAKTVYDVAPADISPLSGEALRRDYL